MNTSPNQMKVKCQFLVGDIRIEDVPADNLGADALAAAAAWVAGQMKVPVESVVLVEARQVLA